MTFGDLLRSPRGADLRKIQDPPTDERSGGNRALIVRAFRRDDHNGPGLSVAVTAPDSHFRLAVADDGFPPSGIMLVSECAGSGNLFPGAALRAGLKRKDIAFAGTVIHLSRADTREPDLAVRCGKGISTTLSDSIKKRVGTCRAAT